MRVACKVNLASRNPENRPLQALRAMFRVIIDFIQPAVIIFEPILDSDVVRVSTHLYTIFGREGNQC